MLCSTAQLVLGNDIIGMVKRFVRGIDVNKETIAREVIAAVGPGGNFLQQEHTLKNFKHELWRSTVFTRQPYDTWLKKGSRDTNANIADRIKKIIDNHKVLPLSDKIILSLEFIKKNGEAELKI